VSVPVAPYAIKEKKETSPMGEARRERRGARGEATEREARRPDDAMTQDTLLENGGERDLEIEQERRA
jgi:hypothetical protein